MKTVFFRTVILCVAFCTCLLSPSLNIKAELYEVRSYILDEDSDEDVVDKYVAHALIPALTATSLHRSWNESLDLSKRGERFFSFHFFIVFEFC